MKKTYALAIALALGACAIPNVDPPPAPHPQQEPQAGAEANLSGGDTPSPPRDTLTPSPVTWKKNPQITQETIRQNVLNDLGQNSKIETEEINLTTLSETDKIFESKSVNQTEESAVWLVTVTGDLEWPGASWQGLDREGRPDGQEPRGTLAYLEYSAETGLPNRYFMPYKK